MVNGRTVVAVGASVLTLLGVAVWPAAPAGSNVARAAVSRSAARGFGSQVDFPAFMHDAAHSAFSPKATSIKPASTLSLAYVFQEQPIAKQLPPMFFSTPLVLSHVIYVGSNSGEFYAINLSTGAVIWKEFLGFEPKFECKALGFFATAASGIDPNSRALTIYAASGDGNVYALRASDGTILWKSPVNVPSPGKNDYFAFSSPEIANGKVYVGISSQCDNPLVRGGLAALDQASGRRVATYYSVPAGQLGASIWTSPAIDADGSLYVTTGNAQNGSLVGDGQSVVRLDPNTLRRLDGWQVTGVGGDSDFSGSPTLFSAKLGGPATPMVGACNKDGFYYAWKAHALSAGPVWQIQITPHPTPETCEAGAIWDGAHLYVSGSTTTIGGVSYRGSIQKVDPATGKALWITGLPAAIRTSPTLDGARAIAAASYDPGATTNSGFLIDAGTGTYQLVDDGKAPAAASPVFADQYLVIATVAGAIYTYH